MDGRASEEYPEEPPRIRSSGPGWMVAAAFIGPGTVTTATVAGVRTGAALLWALLFSTLATVALQEMAARLGLVTGAGLGEAIRRRFEGPLGRVVAVALVISAIAIGNAAYETGNLLGGALGVGEIAGGEVRIWALVMGGVAFLVLWSGRYALVERTLTGLVAVMSVAFLATAVRVVPEVPGLLRGLLVPGLPDGSVLLAVGLIGTTVVPYNLFLHASAVGERWSRPEELPAARRDLGLSIAVGGIVSMAVVVTSAGTLHGTGIEVESAAGMARQLEPVLGAWARVFFGVGLLAAGITSAITAPLAAAYATAGCLGWERSLTSARFRAVWMVVLGVGAVLAGVGLRPVPAILFAQAANGIVLPAVAVFLLVAANDRRWMGERANGLLSNAAGAVVVAVTVVLGARALLGVFGVL